MSRLFFVIDAGGERQLPESALPLRLGGGKRADIALPGLPEEAVVATIALSQSHPFVQPEDDGWPLFHNHERLLDSAWLKSGDRLEVKDAVIDWEVKGDQVFIRVSKRERSREPVPPREAPPGQSPAGSPPANPLPVSPAQAPAKEGRLRKSVIVLLSLLLLGAAAFLLFASPVRIEIIPQPERQFLQGKIPTVPLWGRRLALPGEYRLTAERRGYRTLRKALRISPGDDAGFRFQMEELPGLVAVQTEPGTAFHLLVDGKETAVPEGVAEIDRGEHTLRVESERYLPEERVVEIEGLGAAQEVRFELRPAWAELTVGSNPPRAEVRLDGVVIGTTPLRTEVMQGPRKLVLSLAGHKPLALDLEVEAGKALHHDQLALEPLDGRLKLESRPAGATVTVDGEFRGVTPLELTLASGKPHAIVLGKSGHRSRTEQVRLESEEEKSLSVTLQPEIGVVFLRTRPADAKLLIDGKPAGKATRRLRLPARPHELEICKAGYAPQKISVTPRPGDSQSVEVELKTVAEEKAARTPPAIRAPAGERKGGGKEASAAGPVLKLVRPGGPFTMGASRREAGRRANEGLRQVQLSRPYYLGEREVTNAEFRRFDPKHDSGSVDGTALNGNRQPVVNVSWDEAARYCNWLSSRAGLPPAYREENGRMKLVRPVGTGYRLPTEAEWAYAARILGRDRPARYPWQGSYPPQSKAGNYADARLADTLADVVPGYDDGYRGTAPVGSYPPTPGGFHDLGGNVAEWIGDYYAASPGRAGGVEKDPLGPAAGTHHVVRGSGWRHGNITELRLSYRDYSSKPRPDLGFRVARYAE